MNRALRLTLTLARYPEGDRWTWSLHSGRHIVATSGGQLFTRRVDAARGAEVGAGLEGVCALLAGKATRAGEVGYAERLAGREMVRVSVVVRDERAA